MSDADRRIVVLSRNPTMTWGLTIPGCSIDSVRPQHLAEWATNAREEAVDLILLELATSAEAIEGVSMLRANARLAPILLMTGDDESWHQEAVLDLPGTRLMKLPVDRQQLILAIGELLGIDVRSDAPSLRHPGDDDAALATLAPPTLIDLAARRPDDSPSTADGPRVIPVSTSNILEEATPVDGDLSDPHAAVRAVLRRSERLYGVGETATAITSDISDRVRQDAACLMVHDDLDGEWHVVAQHGLAHVERHMRLSAESWWISSVVHGGQAAILTNEQGSSLGLGVAPLSHRRQLLACTIPGIDALLLVGRDDEEPFSEVELDSVASIVEEAGRLLADAVDVRRLARALTHMIERPERLGP